MASKPRNRADLALATLAIISALVAIFLWIPADSASGLIETVRRQTRVGDALGPTVAASFIVLGGVLTLARPGRSTACLIGRNLVFLAILLSLFAVCIALMRWGGPMAVSVFAAEGTEYRVLRDTAPWKYIGFIAGGGLLVFAMIARGDRRLYWRAALIAILACLALIAVYDLPFDDLLLPPNGDV